MATSAGLVRPAFFLRSTFPGGLDHGEMIENFKAIEKFSMIKKFSLIEHFRLRFCLCAKSANAILTFEILFHNIITSNPCY